MTTLRLLRADWLKTKRSPLRWALLSAPAVYALLMLLYFSTFSATPELPGKMYQAFFEGWTPFLPIMFGVLTGLMSLQEEQAGSFSAVLGLPASRFRIYAVKLLMLVIVTVGSIAVSAALLTAGMKWWLGLGGVEAGVFMKGALLASSGALALGALHLWLSFAFGIGASVGVGGAGLLISAIIGVTSVGDAIWQAVPWAWPVRLAMHPLAAVPLPRILLSALLLFAAVAVFSLFWFHRWEGRKHEE